MKKAGILPGLFLTVIVAAIILLTGCENDLKDLKKISATEATKPVQRYTNVDVIWSDSAKVKAHMTSPLMLDYTKVAKPYTEMPKGVKVIFYDANLNQTCTITSEYAIRHVAEKIIELRKNVVGVNVKGEKFNSEELIWDENTRQIHSSKSVHIQMTDGSILDGLNFVSDEGLTHWKIGSSTGKINVDSREIGQ